MFYKALFCALLLALWPTTAKPSPTDAVAGASDTLPSRFDTNYLADYTNKLTARIFLLFQNASLMLNADNIDKIVYRPNVNVRAGLAGNWRWFGLSLSIDNPFYKTDKEKYGNTSTLDLRLNAFGRKIMGEVLFQRYRSFYIGNPDKPDGTKYIIPDMNTLSLGFAGYWIYNSERFSIRAAFIQNERQKKSSGSLVVRPSFLYYHISSDNGIIPEELMNENHIPIANQIISGDFYSIGLSPGYVYTFVFLKNFYITAAAFPGVAAQMHSYVNTVGDYSDYEFSFQLNGRLVLGYNSDNWFVGGAVQTGFNQVPDKLNNSMFNYDVAQFKIWGGTRFNIFRKKKNTTFAY